jgi:hypothetical protein
MEDSLYMEKPPYWYCEECGHEDHVRAMPKDRESFYLIEEHDCPRCKSLGFHPIGW